MLEMVLRAMLCSDTKINIYMYKDKDGAIFEQSAFKVQYEMSKWVYKKEFDKVEVLASNVAKPSNKKILSFFVEFVRQTSLNRFFLCSHKKGGFVIVL